MREVTPFGEYTEAFRSNDNGPAIVGIACWRPNELGDLTAVEYVKAKPYIRVDDKPFRKITIPAITTGLGYDVVVPTLGESIEELLAGYEHTFGHPLSSYLLDPVPIRNSAMEKALLFGDLLLLVSAKEARSTIDMIVGLFVRLFDTVARIYKAVRHLDGVELIRVAADLWMEARYGWTPLGYEVKALRKYLTGSGLISKVQSASSSGKLDNSLPPQPFLIEKRVGANLFTFKVSMGKVTDVTTKVGFNYVNTAASGNDKNMAKLGLDLDTLAVSAWELIPFSFVIDMFLNIGTMLKLADFDEQVESFNYYQTDRFTMENYIFELMDFKVDKMVTINLDILSPAAVEAGVHVMQNQVDYDTNDPGRDTEYKYSDVLNKAILDDNPHRVIGNGYWSFLSAPAKGKLASLGINPFDKLNVSKIYRLVSYFAGVGNPDYAITHLDYYFDVPKLLAKASNVFETIDMSAYLYLVTDAAEVYNNWVEIANDESSTESERLLAYHYWNIHPSFPYGENDTILGREHFTLAGNVSFDINFEETQIYDQYGNSSVLERKLLTGLDSVATAKSVVTDVQVVDLVAIASKFALMK
jgi:hypothetical protein